MRDILSKHRQSRKLSTWVENRTTYQAEVAELSIFETHTFAEKVSLTFDYPIVASMLTGKKVMHLKGLRPFDFYPGESVVMPRNMEMVIDFPLATQKEPTQCLALGIDPDKIKEVVQAFNQAVAIENENNSWNLDADAAHLINQADIDQLVGRLVCTFTNNSRSKDVLLDLMIQELIIRLLQTKAQKIILRDKDNVLSDTRIGQVIQFIKDNLTNKDITVELLAKKACMSASHFHKKFKNTLGVSPIDYLNSEKIKFAKKIIAKNQQLRLSEVAYLSGYNSPHYFNRKFKQHELVTPSQYRKMIANSAKLAAS